MAFESAAQFGELRVLRREPGSGLVARPKAAVSSGEMHDLLFCSYL